MTTESILGIISYGCGHEEEEDIEDEILCGDPRKYDSTPGHEGCFTEKQFMLAYGADEGKKRYGNAKIIPTCPGDDTLEYSCKKFENKNFGVCIDKNIKDFKGTGFYDPRNIPYDTPGENLDSTDADDVKYKEVCGIHTNSGLCGALLTSYNLNIVSLDENPTNPKPGIIFKNEITPDKLKQIQKFYKSTNEYTNELKITTGNEDYVSDLKNRLKGGAESQSKVSSFYLSGSINAEGGLSKSEHTTHNSIRLDIGKSGFDVRISMSPDVGAELIDDSFVTSLLMCAGLSDTCPGEGNPDCGMGTLGYPEYWGRADEALPTQGSIEGSYALIKCNEFVSAYGTHVLTGISYAGGVTAVETKNDSTKTQTNELAMQLCAQVSNYQDGLTKCSIDEKCTDPKDYCSVTGDTDISAMCKPRRICTQPNQEVSNPIGVWNEDDGPCVQSPNTRCAFTDPCNDPNFYCKVGDTYESEGVCTARCEAGKVPAPGDNVWNTHKPGECITKTSTITDRNDPIKTYNYDDLKNWIESLKEKQKYSYIDHRLIENFRRLIHKSNNVSGLTTLLGGDPKCSTLVLNLIYNEDKITSVNGSGMNDNNMHETLSNHVDQYYSDYLASFDPPAPAQASAEACNSLDYNTYKGANASANFMKITIRGGTDEMRRKIVLPGEDEEEGSSDVSVYKSPLSHLFDPATQRHIQNFIESIKLDPGSKEFDASTGSPVAWEYTSIVTFVDNIVKQYLDNQLADGKVRANSPMARSGGGSRFANMAEDQLRRMYSQAKMNLKGWLVDKAGNCGNGDIENISTNLPIPKFFMSQMTPADPSDTTKYGCWTPSINAFKDKVPFFDGNNIECSFCGKASNANGDSKTIATPWNDCDKQNDCKSQWKKMQGPPVGFDDSTLTPDYLWKNNRHVYYIDETDGGNEYSGGSGDAEGGPPGFDFKPRRQMYAIKPWERDSMWDQNGLCAFQSDWNSFNNYCLREFEGREGGAKDFKNCLGSKDSVDGRSCKPNRLYYYKPTGSGMHIPYTTYLSTKDI